MKILSTEHLRANRLDENMMGDTHTALTGALAQVDRSMADLGLRGAAMGNSEHGKGNVIDGWRTVALLFGRNEQELKANSANNILVKFDRVWYERRQGVIILKRYDAYQNYKTLSFELARVLAEPQVGEVYQLARINNGDSLANPAVNHGYTVMMFSKLVANRQRA